MFGDLIRPPPNLKRQRSRDLALLKRQRSALLAFGSWNGFHAQLLRRAPCLPGRAARGARDVLLSVFLTITIDITIVIAITIYPGRYHGKIFKFSLPFAFQRTAPERQPAVLPSRSSHHPTLCYCKVKCENGLL